METPFLKSIVEKSRAVAEADQQYVDAVARFNTTGSDTTAGEVDDRMDDLIDAANDLIKTCHRA